MSGQPRPSLGGPAGLERPRSRPRGPRRVAPPGPSRVVQVAAPCPPRFSAARPSRRAAPSCPGTAGRSPTPCSAPSPRRRRGRPSRAGSAARRPSAGPPGSCASASASSTSRSARNAPRLGSALLGCEQHLELRRGLLQGVLQRTGPFSLSAARTCGRHRRACAPGSPAARPATPRRSGLGTGRIAHGPSAASAGRCPRGPLPAEPGVELQPGEEPQIFPMLIQSGSGLTGALGHRLPLLEKTSPPEKTHAARRTLFTEGRWLSVPEMARRGGPNPFLLIIPNWVGQCQSGGSGEYAFRVQGAAAEAKRRLALEPLKESLGSEASVPHHATHPHRLESAMVALW